MHYKAGLQTRDKILDATRRLIAEAGLEGTTIKAICDRAGVLPGSFYNLFDSKEQAIVTVVREAIEAVDPDPEHLGKDTLTALVDAYIVFMTEQADLAGVYIAIAVSGSRNNPDLRGRFLRHHEGRSLASPRPSKESTRKWKRKKRPGVPRRWFRRSTG